MQKGARVDRAQRADAAPLRRAAAREPGRALASEVRRPLQSVTGHDFGRVRVHDGAASHAIAEEQHADAVTAGRHIFLGRDAARLPLAGHRRLLAHESIHTMQQSERPLDGARQLPVSSPADASEREASTRLNGVALQRNLKATHTVDGGKFKMDMNTIQRVADDSGMDGFITFTPAANAPDGKDIRLMQSTRVTNDEKGGVPVAPRNSPKELMTQADPNNAVQGGWQIDITPGRATPRTAKTDPDVSPYYADHSPYKSLNRNGWKIGPNISAATIYDHPMWNKKSTWQFETVAQDVKTGHVYGTVEWGFKIADGWLGVVTNEYERGRNVTLRNTDKALEKFNEYFRNKGTKDAP